jgi:hypothetical protein
MAGSTALLQLAARALLVLRTTSTLVTPYLLRMK